MKLSNPFVVLGAVFAATCLIMITMIILSHSASEAQDATTFLFQLVLWCRALLFLGIVVLGAAMSFTVFNVESTDRQLIRFMDWAAGLGVVIIVWSVLVPYFFRDDLIGWSEYYRLTHPVKSMDVVNRHWTNLVTPRQDFSLDLLLQMLGMILGALVPLAVLVLAWLSISRIIKDRRP